MSIPATATCSTATPGRASGSRTAWCWWTSLRASDSARSSPGWCKPGTQAQWRTTRASSSRGGSCSSPARTSPEEEAMLISLASRKGAITGVAVAVTTMMAGEVLAQDDRGISQSGEQKNMRRVGHVDLQGRPSYQPNVIVYPDGRTIAFAGTHGGSKPNPLKGGVVEQNGTMIIDVTNPERPV